MLSLRIQHTILPKGRITFDLFVLLGKTNGCSNLGGELFVLNAIQRQF